MLVNREDYEGSVSSTLGVTLLVGVVVVLTVLVFMTTNAVIQENSDPGYVGATVNHVSESTIKVQLDNVQKADRVYVRSAVGENYELKSVGDSVRILNIEQEGQMALIVERNGEKQVVQQIEPHSFNPDITVGKGEDFSPKNYANPIQAAVDSATSDNDVGEIIVVERGVYTGSVTIDGQVVVVGGYGAVINPPDSASYGVKVSSDGAAVMNFKVNADSVPTGVSITGSDVTMKSMYVTNAGQSGVVVSGNSNKVLRNRVIGNNVGVQVKKEAKVLRNNIISKNAQSNFVNEEPGQEKAENAPGVRENNIVGEDVTGSVPGQSRQPPQQRQRGGPSQEVSNGRQIAYQDENTLPLGKITDISKKGQSASGQSSSTTTDSQTRQKLAMKYINGKIYISSGQAADWFNTKLVLHINGEKIVYKPDGTHSISRVRQKTEVLGGKKLLESKRVSRETAGSAATLNKGEVFAVDVNEKALSKQPLSIGVTSAKGNLKEPGSDSGSTQTVVKNTKVNIGGKSSSSNGGSVSDVSETQGSQSASSQQSSSDSQTSTTLATQELSTTSSYTVSAGDTITTSVGKQIKLSASVSDIDSRKITSYEWSLGDGTKKTGRQVSHTYTSAGTYSARVMTVSESGIKNTDLVEVIVTKEKQPNTAPSASMSISPTPVVENKQVTLSGDGSYDPDGDGIVAYKWDFNGNGVYDATGKRVTHTFKEDKSYSVSLKVVDGRGSTDTVTKTIKPDKIDEVAPTAQFSYTVTDKKSNTVRFDASASSDSNTITSYRWDFDSDAAAEKTGEVVTHTFSKDSGYNVELTVSDGRNKRSVSKYLTLYEGRIPLDKITGRTIAAGDVVVDNFEDQNSGDSWSRGGISSSASQGDYSKKFNKGNGGTGADRTDRIHVPNKLVIEVSAQTNNNGWEDASRIGIVAYDSNNNKVATKYTKWSPNAGCGNSWCKMSTTLELPKGTEYFRVVWDGADRQGYWSNYNGHLDKLTIEAKQAPLQAQIDGPKSTLVGNQLTYSANKVYSPNGYVKTYEWDFDNDGTTDATGETVSKTYTSAGEHEVSLSISDGTKTKTVSQRVRVYKNKIPLDTVLGETAPMNQALFDGFEDGSASTWGSTSVSSNSYNGKYAMEFNNGNGGIGAEYSGKVYVDQWSVVHLSAKIKDSGNWEDTGRIGVIAYDSNGNRLTPDQCRNERCGKVETFSHWTAQVNNCSGGWCELSVDTKLPKETEYVRVVWDGTDADGWGANYYGSNMDNVRLKFESAPVYARFEHPDIGLDNTNIAFDALDTYSPDGEVDSYLWDFDGDGSYEREGSVVTHRFQQGGEHQVTLKAVNDGNSDTKTESILIYEEKRPLERVVNGNALPTGTTVVDNFEDETATDAWTRGSTSSNGYDSNTAKSFNNGNGNTGADYTGKIYLEQQSKISATAKIHDSGDWEDTGRIGVIAYNSDGQIVSQHYSKWTVHKSGSCDERWCTLKASGTVPQSTEYIRLKWDGADRSGWGSNYVGGELDAVNIDIKKVPPKAKFTTSKTDNTVTFDASDSTAVNGQIESYEWDFDNDGTTDATGKQTTHTFASDNRYTTKLTVTSSNGASDTVTHEVDLRDRKVRDFGDSSNEISDNQLANDAEYISGIKRATGNNYVQLAQGETGDQLAYAIEAPSNDGTVTISSKATVYSFENSGMMIYVVDADGDKKRVWCNDSLEGFSGLPPCNGSGGGWSGSKTVSMDSEIQRVVYVADMDNVAGTWYDWARLYKIVVTA